MAIGLQTVPTPMLVFDGPDDPAEPPDPVLSIAADRPEQPNPPAPADPAADHFDPGVADRREDVEAKHRRLIAFLDERGLDGVVLSRADSIAWFTAGGDLGQDLGGDHAAVLLYINRQSRAVLADNVQSARVFEEELAGLGFQLKERPWYDDPEGVVAELTHNKKVVSDNGVRGLPSEPDALRRLRLTLTRRERQLLRELGRTMALAVEATCRNFQPDETEADLAGHLAHRLFREGVVPLDLRVAGDDRLARYRQAGFKPVPIGRRATIAATGRRSGLCASLSRTVCFGPVDEEFRKAQGLASMVDATCIYFSRPGVPISEVFRRARRIYEKFGHAHEWTLNYQGFLMGYSPRELPLRPQDETPLAADMAVRWCPSVGAARSEDTIALDSRGGFEVVTEAQQWPKVGVQVKGFHLPRPAVLIR